MPKKLALALVACLVLPAAASHAAQPVNSARGKLTFGTKKRPGPVVSLAVRSRLTGGKRVYAGSVTVTDRRRRVRFKGALVAKSVKGVGERKLVGTAVKKLGRRRYTLKFTLTDRGKKRDSLVLRISGPKGKGARRAGRGYRFKGTARKGNISITRVPAFARPVGPIVKPPPSPGPGPGPGPGPDPPDPSAVSATVASTVFDTTKFIYEGAGAAQTGVASGTIEANRAAVLRGRVTDRAGAAVGGVTVRVLDHPEFGQTVTDSAGAYALVVNGGEELTLTLTRAGFVPLQRSVEPEWQRWERLEDVVLTPRQATATAASFTADGGLAPIVARGAAENDGDGTRRGTLVIPDDTTAQMTMPDGSTEPLSGGNLRITEVTVGDTGPAAMTAPLPPQSGYTYAVDLSVDEAEAAGASELTFSQPLPYYTENFLGFPVGTTVPLGSYDEQKAAWVPANSGRVVKIVSESGGEAQVDTDGDDIADNTNVSVAEQVQLASLYAPGDELWRVELPHFSTWDLNWGVRPPEDARPPDNQPPPRGGGGGGGGGGQGPDNGFGSINPDDQVLVEDIGLTGIDFGLSHTTRRSAGYDPARTVEVRVEDPLPGDVKRIEIDVSVAGRRLTRTLHKPGTVPPGGQAFSPGQIIDIEWDGLDTFGRRLVGGQRARVRVGHTYAAEYGTTSRFGYSQGPAITASPTREDLTLWTERTESLGTIEPEAAALGGFSPSVHHTYDPVGEVLYEGDGGVRSGAATAPVIETIARDETGAIDATALNIEPDGAMTWYATSNARMVRRTPDGTVARLRQGSAPGNPNGDWLGGNPNSNVDGLPVEEVGTTSGARDFERAPDGTFLYIDRACRTRQIYRDSEDVWRVRTIAGKDTEAERCYQRPLGDGGSAVDAGFDVFGAATVVGHPDGSILIGDTQRVRRVTPDGLISTMGIAEVPSQFATSGNINDLSVDREGRVLWRTECFVGRIELDGTSTLLAGRDQAMGAPLPFEEGISALLPSACGAVGNAGGGTYGSVETGPDGAIYFNMGRRVMRIGADGALTTYAGKGTLLINNGDGGPARQAQVREVAGLGFDGEGRLVIATGYNGDAPPLIRRIDAPLPGFQRTDATYRIPSEDAREVYVFGATGRHLRTRDALTGATIWEFGYDSAGRLTSVDDVDGDRSTVERNGTGVATAIEGPDGDRTALTHDASTRLTSVRNPANETTAFEWAGGDLLAAVTGARGNRFAFTYNTQGRITRADDPTDPAGPEGFRTYTRTRNATTDTVTAESALGRETVHRVIRPDSGAQRRTVTDPAGEVTTEETATNDQIVITTPDGTVMTSTLGPDPRYGMLAPVRTSTEINPPGSTPTATTLGERTIAGLDALDPFSFTSLTEKVSETNGTPATGDDRTATSIYASGPRTLELRSAQTAARKITATLDAKGRVTQVDRPGEGPVNIGYRADGQPASQSQGGRAFVFAYDAGGRPQSITDPSGSTVGLDHDAAGRLSLITQPAPVGGTVAIGHDASGNADEVTTPRGGQHAFSFRPVELLSEATPPSVGADPASGATAYEHDADRAVTEVDEPGAAQVSGARDPATGRLASTTATGAGTTSFSYNSAGQVSGVAAPDATLALGYDGVLPTSETWSAGVVGSVSRVYDADHRVASRSVSGDGAASTVDFAYDADRQLTAISGAMAATVERHAETGRVAAIESGAGPTREEWSYSTAFGEMSGQEVTHNGAGRYDVSYTREALGRVASKTETIGADPALTTTYTYDAAGRLRTATVDGDTTTYTWDQNGNRTSGGATFDAQDRLTQTAGVTFTHTADGRRRTRVGSDGTTTYDYDALDALRGVDLPTGDDVAYKIDGAGRRVERSAGSDVTRWLYDSQDRIVAELDGGNDLVSSFAYLPGDHSPFLMRRGGNTYRLVSDQVGSIRLVIDTSDGSVAQRIDYDPFGVPDYSGPQEPGFIPFGFAGGHQDPATGLVRMGARDYDPATGRFTAKDPAGFAGGYSSLYAYVGGDPVNQVDPTGLGPSPELARVLTIDHRSGKGRGKLQYRRKGGAWKDADVNTVIQRGDQVRTDGDTRAKLEFFIGGRVSLGPKQTVSVDGERSVSNPDDTTLSRLGDGVKEQLLMGVDALLQDGNPLKDLTPGGFGFPEFSKTRQFRRAYENQNRYDGLFRYGGTAIKG